MQKKQLWIVLSLAALLLVGSICAYFLLRPAAAEGSKTVTVTVDHLAGEDTSFTFRTDALYLRGALEEQKLIAGTEQEYGLWVQTVDGETADDAAQQWWGFDVNGVMAAYGVDAQPIYDGDTVDFTLHVGW